MTAPILNPINPNEVWGSDTLRDKLIYGNYLNESDEVEFDEWPEPVKYFWDKEATVLALGLTVVYLQEVMDLLKLFIYLSPQLKLDKQLVMQKNFKSYNPLVSPDNLILDGKTLANLEILGLAQI